MQIIHLYAYAGGQVSWIEIINATSYGLGNTLSMPLKVVSSTFYGTYYVRFVHRLSYASIKEHQKIF